MGNTVNSMDAAITQDVGLQCRKSKEIKQSSHMKSCIIIDYYHDIDIMKMVNGLVVRPGSTNWWVRHPPFLLESTGKEFNCNRKTGWITEEKVIQPGLFCGGRGETGSVAQDARSVSGSHPDRVTREPSPCHTF